MNNNNQGINRENIPLDEFLERDTSCVDFFKNDKCSECGSCCGRYMSLTNKEINQIKAYIKKHDIKRNFHSANVLRLNVYDMTCPFLDDSKANHKCNIYEVRPRICREFTCRGYINGFKPSVDLVNEIATGLRKKVDLTETFFPSMPKEYKEFIGRVKECKEQVEP